MKEIFMKYNPFTLDIEIEVDGGIKLNNIQEIAEEGADIIVSGSGIFNGKPQETIAEMKKII